MWYIYTMKYYSALKKKKNESAVVRWINLELVITSEVNQKEKNKCCIITHKESRKIALMNLFTGKK